MVFAEGAFEEEDAALQGKGGPACHPIILVPVRKGFCGSVYIGKDVLHYQHPGVAALVQIDIVCSERMFKPWHIPESPHLVVIEPRPEEFRKPDVFLSGRRIAALFRPFEEEIDVTQVSPCPVTVF